MQCGEAVNPAVAVQPLSSPSPVPALNVCVATAWRLAEIAQRNTIRREANLPLLSAVRELRRMEQQEDLQEFERFAWDEVLKGRREAEGGSNWRPNWMEGVLYQNEVYGLLRQRFYTPQQ
jgi:hypothetical protein